jgi:tRNA C32,U32 (ribose-2'-O)-methylase TrmJ
MQQPRAESHELLGRIFKRLDIKRWATWINLSVSTLYKWQEQSPKDDELPFEPSGRINPFDRVEQIVTKLQAEGQQDLVDECADWFMRLFGRRTFSDDEIDTIRGILMRERKAEKKRA